jgi:hypothetical protein
MHYPLILTVQVEAAINLVRLLFAFKREAPIALTLHRAIMQLRAHPVHRLHKRRPRIFSLRIPFAQNIPKDTSALSVDQIAPPQCLGGSRICNLQLVIYGSKEESGLLVTMPSQTSGGGKWLLCYPIPNTFMTRGFQAFHYVSCSGAVSI